MFKIGDFSKLGQVSTRMLRHYDKLGLLKPSHIDKWTSYRYYTIDQLARLHRIIALKELGLTLEQIAQLLERDDGLPVEQLRGMLHMRQAEISQELQDKKIQLNRVEARLRQLEDDGQPSPYEIVVKPVPAQAVASIRQIVPTLAEMDYYCRHLYEQLYVGLKRLDIEPSQPEFTLYHNEEYVETNLDVETAVSIDPQYLKQTPLADHILCRELPACDLTAALIYKGPFTEMTSAVLALLTYVGQHNHIIAGPLRDLHLSGPAHEDGVVQETAVLELQLPIKRFVYK